MMRVYQTGDVLKVKAQQAQIDEVFEAVKYFDEVGAYSLIDEDENVLAVFGFAVTGDGAADCYALVSQRVGKYLIEAIRFFNLMFPKLMKKFSLDVVYMTVKSQFRSGERFAGLLGFKKVSDLPQFYNGNDYQLFERIYV